MESCCVNLNIDREKLNSNFDGYKLSLDSIPAYKKRLEFGKLVFSLTSVKNDKSILCSCGNISKSPLCGWHIPSPKKGLFLRELTIYCILSCGTLLFYITYTNKKQIMTTWVHAHIIEWFLNVANRECASKL